MSEKTELLRQEVRELTDMLRSSDDFNELKDALTARNISVQETTLAGFIESEDEEGYGAIITRDLRCIAWETDEDGSITRWETIDNPESLLSSFAAISVGISMVRDHEI